jgi:hypothetical protein
VPLEGFEPSRYVTNVSIDNAIASLAVKELKSSVEWYQRLFGRSPDSIPMATVAEWKFPRGGWLQVYELPERAGQGSCTLAVSNIDEMIAVVEKLGVNTRQRTSEEKVKTLMITDLDGNHIAFAEAIDKNMAR